MIRIGFTASQSLLSRFIRWATKSRTSHAFLLIEPGLLGKATVLQSTLLGFEPALYSTISAHTVALVTPRVDIESGVVSALPWLGEYYDLTGLFGMAFVLVGRWFKYKWRNPLHASHAMFCSEAVVYVLKAANYPGAEALDPSATSPEDLLEFLEEERVLQ